MAVSYEPVPVAHTKFDSDSFVGGSIPATFDAFLYKPRDAFQQLKLTIQLRVNLKQAAESPIPLILDEDTAFWTKPWHDPDWQNFIRGAALQADMWNNKFWLIPPDTCDAFDVSGGMTVWRPNFRCELAVDFRASKNFHTTIEVANLIPGTINGPRHGGTFRTHSRLYDSLDLVPWISPSNDLRYTIAHEIGHSLGWAISEPF